MPTVTITLHAPTAALPSGLTWTAQEYAPDGTTTIGSQITTGFTGPVSGDYTWVGTVTQTGEGFVRFTEPDGGRELEWDLSEGTSSGGAGETWYYADQQAVEDLIGTDNLNIVFDTDDDETVDAGAVVRAGEFTDSYIDAALTELGLTAPLVLASNATAATLLRSASAHLAAWYGFHQRGLRDAASGQAATAISGIMEGYKAFADELIGKAGGVLTAVDDPTAEFAGGGGATAITPCLNNNDVNRMVSLGCWGGRIPDAVPIW